MRTTIAIIGDRDTRYFHTVEVVAFLHNTDRDSIILTLGMSGVCRVVERTAREQRFSRAVYEPVLSDQASSQAYEIALQARAIRMIKDASRLVAFWTGRRDDIVSFAIRTALKAAKSVDVFTENIKRTVATIDVQSDYLRVFDPKRLDL